MLCKLNKNRIETYTIEPFEDSYYIELEQKLIEMNDKHRMGRAGDVELIKSIVKTLIDGISDFNNTLSAANMSLGFSKYAHPAYKPYTDTAINRAVNLLKMFELHKDSPKSMDLLTTEIIKGVEIATIADEFPREFSERFPGLLGLNNSRFVQILKSVKDINVYTNLSTPTVYNLVFTISGGGEIVFRLYIKYDENMKYINLGLEYVNNSLNAEMIMKSYVTVYNEKDDISERAGYGIEINVPISLIIYHKYNELAAGVDLYKYSGRVFADLIEKYDLANKMRHELELEELEEEI